jgi:predicted transcriptional regulator
VPGCKTLPLFRAIAAAYASGGSTMQDIGDYFALHYSRASKSFRAESQYRSGARGKSLFPQHAGQALDPGRQRLNETMTENAKMPSAKEAARQIIELLPEQATWDDIMYELYVKQKIEEGLADIEAGRTVPHEQVKAELLGRGD